MEGGKDDRDYLKCARGAIYTNNYNTAPKYVVGVKGTISTVTNIRTPRLYAKCSEGYLIIVQVLKAANVFLIPPFQWPLKKRVGSGRWLISQWCQPYSSRWLY